MHWNKKQQSRYCTLLELMFYVGYHRSGTICLLGYVQNIFTLNISHTDHEYNFSLSY